MTRSVKKDTFAEVKLDQSFPKRFTIYDLNQFLAIIGQFKTPMLDFDESDMYVRISDEAGGLVVKYGYGEEALAYQEDPKKKLKLPSDEVEFEFTEQMLKSLSTMAKILSTPLLALESDGEKLTLTTIDPDNTSSNTNNLVIGDAPSDIKFKFVWKIDYLRLISGTYTVNVSKAGLSRFKHKDMNLTYHIMLEAKSSSYDE